jgi:hypothetical protein
MNFDLPSGLKYLTSAGVFAVAGMAGLWAGSAKAADVVYQEPSMNMVDPTPVAQQKPAVDGINFKLSVLSGAIGGYTNHMFIGSAAVPMPMMPSMGVQLDMGIGKFGDDYTSAASALHIFHRDPDRGLIGIYGDWGYVNPEHGGRIGVEAAMYNGRWSVDVLAGVQFGQHFETRFIDEVDLTYYFTDNFKGSVGHRLISRGHVANVAFEYMPDAAMGWSIFGEAEAGEDDYHSAWLGLRYSFGQSAANTLIERDRTADPIVRIPRNLASMTRCGDGDLHESWNGFVTHETENLCASRADLDEYNAVRTK